MKTATLNRMLGGATPFERLVNSDIGRRYLARARQNADAMERAAQESREQRSVPHVDAVRRKVAEAQRAALLSDDQPACTKFDAARVATECCNDDPRDHGLRRAALYLRKVWESDPDGALTVADLARARERVCRDYPKSAARSLFDEAIPLVSFETLDRSGLAAIARQIENQQDFDRVIVEYGLGGNDARSRRARQYVLALANRQENSAQPRPFDRSGQTGGPGECPMCRFKGYMSDFEDGCPMCAWKPTQREPQDFQTEGQAAPMPQQADAPEGWDKTVEKMKEHPEVDNPFALANWMKDKGYEPKESVRQAEVSCLDCGWMGHVVD